MIQYNKELFSNGLTLITHQDKSTPMVAFNLLYKVGAKNEKPEKTGYAHLFEHLMFGGSENIKDFDTPVQMASGENNAYTTNDFTNYYIVLPKNNIEIAFWLESDRMKALEFSQRSLDVQKHVVIEEFKQRYLNQPYGDEWMYLREMAYTKHPYSWLTIGKDIKHIEIATLDDIREFFYNHYAPNNAILSVVGDIDHQEIVELTKKWFGDIEQREIKKPSYPEEPAQTAARFMEVKKEVPMHKIHKVYHMCGRLGDDFYAADLLSDVLSNGDSSRLYQHLIKNGHVFSSIDAYLLGSIDPGLFIFSGKINQGESIEEAEKILEQEIQEIVKNPVSDYELQKVKNKVESTIQFSEISPLNKAMNLCMYESIGKLSEVNEEIENYRKVGIEDIQRVAKRILRHENSSTLFYKSENESSN